MVIMKIFHCGARMLIAGAALHGLCSFALASEVESADYGTANVSRGKQVAPISFETGEGCGVARVPGCANGACANGTCGVNSGLGSCGPQSYSPYPGWGPCGCPTCRASRRKGGYSQQVGSYTFHDAGQALSGGGQYIRSSAPGMSQPQADWNDEFGNNRCPEHGVVGCRHCHGWWAEQWALFHARNHQQGAILRAHCHGKLAYFHPMGNGGQGVPPFGGYQLVYPVTPDYFDARDSQIYAAQGWGIPMAVPLAPTVRYTMNYSQGIPSSRLTPISNVVPPVRRHW